MVVNMYIDKDVMVGLAKEALGTETAGKEDWCIWWLEWFWRQEIDRAIDDVRRRSPDIVDQLE